MGSITFQKIENIEALSLANEVLCYAINIGEQMLISGAEVGRVEDSIRRICSAYGATRTDVLTITASIVVTMYGPEYGVVTQTRRIAGQKQDFLKLDRLNDLSRYICKTHPKVETVAEKLREIEQGPVYSTRIQLLIYAMVSASFSIFFGGHWQDAIVAAMIGVLLKLMDILWKKLSLNLFVATLFSSAIGGLLATLAVRYGVGLSADKISIGNIMLMIPGIALTNSIRDLFGGDTISGALRFFEAILLSMTIAFGFVAARYLIFW